MVLCNFRNLRDTGVHAHRIEVMICNYACEVCGFLFQRSGQVSECPYCDGQRIRPATGKETEQLMQILNGATKAPSYNGESEWNNK